MGDADRQSGALVLHVTNGSTDTSSTLLAERGFAVARFDVGEDGDSESAQLDEWVLDRLAATDLPIALFGQSLGAEAVFAVAPLVRQRLIALAAFGGRSAVLLESALGLRAPALLVGTDINRRTRRRALRRLPRGSEILRIADGDHAVLAARSFFERALTERPEARSTLVRAAARLVPAAVAVTGVVTGMSAPANGSADCTPFASDGVLTIQCVGDGGAKLYLAADTDGTIRLNGEEVGHASDTLLIEILGTTGAELLVIDESLAKFQTADEATFKQIEFKIDLDDGIDTLRWVGSKVADKFTVADDAIDVLGGSEFEIKLGSVEDLGFKLLDGDDVVDGSEYSSKLLLAGGTGDDLLVGGSAADVLIGQAGNDHLVGGLGDDWFKLSTLNSDSLLTELGFPASDGEAKETALGNGTDDLEGDEGYDRLDLSTNDALISIGATSIKLQDDESISTFDGFEDFKFVGGELAQKIELADLKFVKLDLDGGLGANELHLFSDHALIKITDSSVRLTDTTSELKFNDIAFKYFDDLKLVGGDTDQKIEVSGLKYQKIDLDGGTGIDELKLLSDDSLIKITDSTVELTDTTGELKFTDFADFKFVGERVDQKIELSAFKYSKIDIDGLSGAELKVLSDDPLIKITDTSLSLSETAGQVTFKILDLKFAGGQADQKIEIGSLKYVKLDVDGGGGINEIKLLADDSLIKITDTNIKLDTTEVAFKQIGALGYVGGAAANKVDGAAVTTVELSLDGGAGDDILFAGSKADALLGGLGNDVLRGGAGADLLGGGLGNDQIFGEDGIDTLREEVNGDVVATSSELGGAGSDSFSGIESLHLIGGDGDNRLDASRFKGGAVTLDGGLGDDILIGSAAADTLIGNLGDDELRGLRGDDFLFAGDGDDVLDGGSGFDTGDGGAGTDVGKSIESAQSIER